VALCRTVGAMDLRECKRLFELNVEINVELKHPRSSRRTLPEYKARSGISTSSICQRSTPAMVAMELFYPSPSMYAYFNS